MSSSKQSLVLVICRAQLNPNLISPLKIIIPMLYNLIPIRIFISDNTQIIPTKHNSKVKSLALYDQLVYHLENNQRICDLAATLQHILADYRGQKFFSERAPQKVKESIASFLDNKKKKNKYLNKEFRVCLIGTENVNWNIIMEYKRNNIVIDTAGTIDKVQRLVQISYITGGIHKIINERTMVKVFLCDLSMSTQMRKICVNDQKQTVEFSLQCYECKGKVLKQDFLSCSICMAIFCIEKHEKMKSCTRCSHYFD